MRNNYRYLQSQLNGTSKEKTSRYKQSKDLFPLASQGAVFTKGTIKDYLIGAWWIQVEIYKTDRMTVNQIVAI